ncbi:hypothetical protein PHYPSEUDO_014854 [Phytophthora pseudosyringae]|uniref:AGC protein kinase n=1 Tax=Phytophthora pseudosyringae TaxID=221518 RepID=A0A8T1W337_9STRA|nr:hypothetical protein PHYPSEUDO_014854 [Phytophthora pseudosyringae]
MRVFPSVEKPSMAPVWRKMREIRAMVTKQPPQHAQQRFSASTWRKSSAQDAAKRFSSATSYLAAVSVKARRRSSVAKFSFASELEKSTEMDEFELLDVLGRGTFGTVHLARHLDTGATVAMKVLTRDSVLELHQEKNIMREQSVHLGLVHPFIARLYATFQDNDALYFVLELCPGGEIYSLVYTHDDGHLEESEDCEDSDEEESRRSSRQAEEVSDAVTTESESDDEQGRQRRAASLAMGRNSLTLENFLFKQKLRSSHGGLHERFAAFYAACLVSALEYLHRRGVLYRDLKLENLVLDADGYPKLVDFGLSKPDATWTTERNSTMCGSAEYMAPEILQHKPYDQRIDLWSFGILLYEMVFGATPFCHANHREQGRRIISEPVQFPDDYEHGHPAMCSLIRKLLEKDPALRLASFAEVKKTTFFRSYFPSTQGWQQLEARQVEAPFIPRLDGPFDTSLFVRVQDEEEQGYGSDADSDFGY